jgi:acetolactate synthase I/II/III large subunit
VVNVDPGNVHLAGPARLTLRADAGHVFRSLLARRDAELPTAAAFGGYQRRRFVPRLASPMPAHIPDAAATDDDLLQSTALAVIEKVRPTDGHIVLDAGNCAAAAIHLTDVPPGMSSTIALGCGGMGYSVAAAIGAQLGTRPGTRTIVICGDGAFLMNGLEVHTAVDLGLPILFVIFNNQLHGMCVTRQQLFFESRIECVSYAKVDFGAVARGLGSPDRLWVGSVGTETQLIQGLADYHRSSAHLPGVLELRLSREEVPPFTPFLPGDEPTAPVSRSPAVLAV